MAPPSSQAKPNPLNRMGILQPKPQLEADYEPVFQAWQKAPGPTTLSPLLTAVNPVLDRAVKHYAPDGGTFARGQAKQLAIAAFKTYDPKKGPLGAHLWSNMQRLQRTAAQSRQIISLPEQVAMQRSQLDAAEQELEDRLGRLPSESELADELKISPKRLAYIRQAAAPVASSRFDDMVGLNPGQQDEGQKAWEEWIYGSLSPVDQVIMDHLTGRAGNKLTGKDLAKRLKITPGAISQRAAKIQKLLSSRDEYGIF